MPNCFQLLRKEDGQPDTLVAVDERLCEMANVEPDARLYYEAWVDSVGLLLAMGQTIEQAREVFEGHPLEEVCAFLELHYTVRAWYERG